MYFWNNQLTKYMIMHILFLFVLKKARIARIRMAKNASGAAFISSKKRAEEAMRARESGLEVEDLKNQDTLEMQHHHLLSCLEKTTVRSY